MGRDSYDFDPIRQMMMGRIYQKKGKKFLNQEMIKNQIYRSLVIRKGGHYA